MVNICAKLYNIPATNKGVMNWTAIYFTFNLDLAIQTLLITNSLTMTKICVNFIPATNEGDTDQTSFVIAFDRKM